MVSFENDYCCGAHPKVLEALVETNMEALSGYGADKYTSSAKEKIKKACKCPDADIYFIGGGTQTNQLIISTMLAPYQGVVAAQTGHVACHEAGAIEYTGHKVMTVPGHDGKMHADELEAFVKTFYNDGNHEHMVFPGMVYISHPTEYGTLYTKEELKAIHEVCKTYSMPLFLDGARLGYGLMSKNTDVTLEDVASLTDVFYIGGTKVGALCGEAVVFTKKNTPVHFVTQVKQHGALLAKGRLCGVQFEALFTDNLYFEISKHAIEKAEKLKEILYKKNIPFFLESPTNQQFIIMENEAYHKFNEKVSVSFWEAYDENHTVLRLATSWSTQDSDLEYLESVL